MRFRRLSSGNELRKYRDQIADKIHVRLPLEYLRRGSVIALYSSQGEIVGGFCIITKGKFRSLSGVPESSEVQVSRRLLSLQASKIAEINGLWFNHRAFKTKRQSRLACFLFWLRLYRELMRSGGQAFIYCYSRSNTKLERLYGQFRPRILYRGQTRMLPGMEKAEQESIEAIERKNILRGPLQHPFFLLRRLTGFAWRSSMSAKIRAEVASA